MLVNVLTPTHIRLHAAVRACLSAAEGDRAAALRWRDALLAALLPPATDDLAEEAEGPPAHSPPEAWLPPHAWPRLPGGAPAALWPAGSDVPMSYTVRRTNQDYLFACSFADWLGPPSLAVRRGAGCAGGCAAGAAGGGSRCALRGGGGRAAGRRSGALSLCVLHARQWLDIACLTLPRPTTVAFAARRRAALLRCPRRSLPVLTQRWRRTRRHAAWRTRCCCVARPGSAGRRSSPGGSCEVGGARRGRLAAGVEGAVGRVWTRVSPSLGRDSAMTPSARHWRDLARLGETRRDLARLARLRF